MERSARAIEQISIGKTFTSEQQQWLERIQQHLAEHLSIDEEDFEYMQSLKEAGGWGKANLVV